MRFRYLLSVNVPITEKTMTDKTVFASACNEIFINDKGTLFYRNRLYRGLGYKLNDKLRFELGYMNQYFGGSSRDRTNVIAFF